MIRIATLSTLYFAAMAVIVAAYALLPLAT